MQLKVERTFTNVCTPVCIPSGDVMYAYTHKHTQHTHIYVPESEIKTMKHHDFVFYHLFTFFKNV